MAWVAWPQLTWSNNFCSYHLISHSSALSLSFLPHRPAAPQLLRSTILKMLNVRLSAAFNRWRAMRVEAVAEGALAAVVLPDEDYSQEEYEAVAAKEDLPPPPVAAQSQLMEALMQARRRNQTEGKG